MGEAANQMQAPRDFQSLRDRIVERRRQLPKRLVQVAAFALDHPDEIAFGTAASIAAAAEVQPSTLVRFARQLGYGGFSDIQQVFRERLRERNSSYEERLAALRAGGSGEQALLLGFLSAAGRSIADLARSVEPETFEKAVSILADAETIFLIAQRRTFPISSYMAYAFGQLRVRSVLIGSPIGIDPEVVALAGPRDAGLAISFSPYAPSTAGSARQLAGQGLPVVAITDSAFSPLADLAQVRLQVSEADFAGFRSLSATMALAMALTVGIAERREQGRQG